jgi:hypothetical protein
MGINPESLPKTQEELAQEEGKVQGAIEEVNLSLFLRLFFTPNSVRREICPRRGATCCARRCAALAQLDQISGNMCSADDAGTELGTLADVLSSSATK